MSAEIPAGLSGTTGGGDRSVTGAAFSDAHRTAVVLAVLVTLLWSSSYILIKIGLRDLPPLTFAGLRYFLGFGVLFLLHRVQRRPMPPRLSPSTWRAMIALGLVAYTLAPGAMFLSLSILPVITANFVFQAGIPLLVALSSGAFLGERTSVRQWLGVVLSVIGIYLAFPARPAGWEIAGLLLAVIGAGAGAASNQLTRYLMRDARIPAQDLTMITVGIGSTALLAIGLALEPTPVFSGSSIGLLFWLAVANTALAFSMWNHAMRTLRALEAGVIATIQVIEVTLMAWIVLGEPLGPSRLVASLLILAGVILVQAPASAHGKEAVPTP